jgi:tryptophanyl-tRNA synthetase
MSAVPQGKRVLSGMRPTGALHLGNYHGALRNWVELQYQYECYFFVADWHALTTGYEDTAGLQPAIHEVIIDWLAAGLNPGVATLFVQSHVPEHAELHLLLSMITPLGWLDLRLPGLSAAAERRHPAVPSRIRAGRGGPGRARGDHA